MPPTPIKPSDAVGADLCSRANALAQCRFGERLEQPPGFGLPPASNRSTASASSCEAAADRIQASRSSGGSGQRFLQQAQTAPLGVNLLAHRTSKTNNALPGIFPLNP